MTEKKRAEELAERLGVEIPDSIQMGLWPLPLLEALVDRIEKLEMRMLSHDAIHVHGR